MTFHFALGIDRLRGRAFELSVPEDVSHHVTLLGVTGSGKTTTAGALARAALQARLAVVIVDAKGGGLRGAAQSLATTARLPYREIVPGAPASLGYNPCARGTHAQVADKLVSAFRHGANAEIYRLIAQESIAMIAAAVRALGEELTVQRLRRELDHKRIPSLAARLTGVAPALREDLLDLANRGRLAMEALEGMRARLGALMQGTYGELFESRADVLDLDEAFASPGVTYFALPALAATSDTALMARVLIQDVKQVAYLQLMRGAAATALLILDEFAALDDPVQICDLLRQAREARIATVVSTQHLPDGQSGYALRASLLSAGLLITHRAAAADADAVAAVLGTERAVEVTRQIDAGAETGAGSVRRVERYVIHPNVIKQLETGEAIVLALVGRRRYGTISIRSTQGGAS